MEVSKAATVLQDISLTFFVRIPVTILVTWITGPAPAEEAPHTFVYSTARQERVQHLLTDLMLYTWEIIFARHAHQLPEILPVLQ